jgi:hypothetical protein
MTTSAAPEASPVTRKSSLSRLTFLAGALAFTGFALVPSPAASQPVRGSYIYTLSGFTGAIRQDWSRIAVDRERGELYALYQNMVRVFNNSGMEVYRFGEDLDVGQILDVAVDDRGDVLLLTYRDQTSAVIRCDYRGRPISEIAFRGFPTALREFTPTRMAYHRGNIYLASTMGLAIAITDRDGNFTKSYDLFRLLELEEKDRGNAEVAGFSVDADGNVLFTVPVLFRAFVLAPDGSLAAFGKPSSAPGGFNIVSGIARDRRGNFVVIDRLKASVLVFDKTFKFVTQFAGYGKKPHQLVFPDDIAVGTDDRIYVTQSGKKGISVFKLSYQ